MASLAAILLLALLLSGCSKPPQVPPDCRVLIEQLRTAASAQQSKWLNDTAKLVEAKHTQQKLSDEQYAEFQKIIAEALAGDWSAAQQEAIRFGQAQ